MSRIAIDLQQTAQWGAKSLYFGTIVFATAGILIHSLFHIGTILLGLLSLYNIYLKHVQAKHVPDSETDLPRAT